MNPQSARLRDEHGRFASKPTLDGSFKRFSARHLPWDLRSPRREWIRSRPRRPSVWEGQAAPRRFAGSSCAVDSRAPTKSSRP
jgi:hypothetical protein